MIPPEERPLSCASLILGQFVAPRFHLQMIRNCSGATILDLYGFATPLDATDGLSRRLLRHVVPDPRCL